MTRYETYKETDFEWIGEIPFDWELSRVGKFFNQRSEKADDVTYPPLSVTMSGIVDQLSNVAKTDDGDNRKLVKKDDFVINSRSDRKGSSGIAPRDGSVSLINIVLEPHGLDSQFIQHLFKSYFFKEEYFRNGKGIHWDLWTTRWDQFKNINIPIPSIEEQKLISRYLDKKTEQIDRLVEKVQRKIELLKEQRTSLINQCVTKGLDLNVEMKDSGIEWIGDIPSHWKKTRLKYLISMNSGYAFKSTDYKENGIQLIKIGNLYQNKLDLSRSPSFLDPQYIDTHPDFIVKNGDLLLSLTGTLGKRDYGFVCRYVLEDPSLLNQRVGRLVKSSSSISDKFLEYYLTSETFLSQLFRRPTGTKQGNLSNDDILVNYIWLPSTETQLEICSYLESKTRILEDEQKLNEIKINLMTEYRQSLISSVVTGKVRVTEDMI